MAKIPYIKPTLKNNLPTKSYLTKLSKQIGVKIKPPAANAGVSKILWVGKQETKIRKLMARLEAEGFNISSYQPFKLKEQIEGFFIIEKLIKEKVTLKKNVSKKSKVEKTKSYKKSEANSTESNSESVKIEEKNKGGRPLYEVDYSVLDQLCAIFCNGEECASILGVDYDTLNKALKREGHGGFTDYFKIKSANGKMALRRAQFKRATSGNTAMLIWMGKQHLEQLEYTRPNYEAAHPVKPEEENTGELTPEEMKRFAIWFEKNY